MIEQKAIEDCMCVDKSKCGHPKEIIKCSKHKYVCGEGTCIFLNAYGLTKWYWLVRHIENFRLGRNVEIGNFTVIGCEYGVQIEDRVKIGYHCTIMSDSTIDNKKGPVLIKKGAKIGANTVIMPNIIIGAEAVIGANSFVNRNIPKKEVWAGTPVKKLNVKDKIE